MISNTVVEQMRLLVIVVVSAAQMVQMVGTQTRVGARETGHCTSVWTGNSNMIGWGQSGRTQTRI